MTRVRAWWPVAGAVAAAPVAGTLTVVSPRVGLPAGRPTWESLVSMLMNDYDYGPLPDDAIESALSQTYSNVEVAVLNDGFTNDSWDAMSLFGERIVAVE
jgi:hypothetical protein